MNNEQKVSLNFLKSIAILIIYFIGYLIVCPTLSIFVTKLLDPNATVIHLPTMIILNVVVLASILFLGKDLLCYAWHSFKNNYKSQIKRIFLMILCILLLNMVLGAAITLITNIQDSQNQEVIKSNLEVAPLFTFFGTCIFAPIVEEFVFRGSIFSLFRKKYGFLSSALVSSFIFGAIHLISSVMSMQWMDLIYIVLYGGMGYILAYNYEKSGSILVSIGIHLGNNLFAFLMLMLK